MSTLRIPCNTYWFEKIKLGEDDFRPFTNHWIKRIEGRTYDTITFTLGYPKNDEESRHYIVPFRGYFKTETMYVIPTK
jgi:signal peptidase I